MFTGIVQTVGEITSLTPIGDGSGRRLNIDGAGLDLSDVHIGDSIAIQGACMTVIALQGASFEVDVSAESLAKTAGLNAPGQVNLEKALRLADRLGGHLVSGHVDGLGRVESFEQVAESWRLDVRAPADIGKYLAYKGSVTINGVSLTINQVRDDSRGTVISINLIPHTVAVTTLHRLRAGDALNLEIDLIARYVERMQSAPAANS